VNVGVLVVAMIAAANPAARAVRLRSLERRRSLLAAVATLVVVVVLAALADPVLDGGDISAPTFRVAAGLVVTAAGLLDLVRRVVPLEPSAGGDLGRGDWAALVPAAFPVLLEPQVGVLAISAGADSGPALAGLAAGIALASFLSAGRLASPLLVPLSRLLAAVGVAAGVALVADGILSV
jgi:small neutral amino acid transporter SnatA (MarC family)